MKSITYVILIATLCITSCGNKRSVHEELASEVMDSMKELADMLMQVSDVETAKAAVTKVAEFGNRFEEIVKKLAPLDPPSDEIRARINEKMEAYEAELMQILGGEHGMDAGDLDNFEAVEIVGGAYGEFYQTMGKVSNEFGRLFKPKSEQSGAEQPATAPQPKSE